MRLKLFLMIVAMLLSAAGLAQRKRAFMVGISHYDTALTGYQWNNINGVEDINLLSPILKKQGFIVTTLLDEQATFENINHQISEFTSKTKKGDIVYLHFSTHGQPVEDLNGDEEDGWDESIVPIDAYKIYNKGKYKGDKHLIDDKLNIYINKLRDKIGPKGFLYVIIDACHAGTSSRANDENIRGTHVGFTYNNKVFRPSTNKKSHYRIDASAKQANVIFIEACRPDQVNMEIKVEGKRYGALSYHLAIAIQKSSINTDPQLLLTTLKREILLQNKWPNNQSLVIESSIP